MSKFVFLFAAIALLHVVSGFTCNCGCGGPAYPIGGFGGLGSSYIGGSALPAYSGSSLIGGGSLLGGSLVGGYSGLPAAGCGAFTYPGRVGLSCTPYTSCTTGTCARPVTVCRQAWQSYPCTSCSTGLSCTPTCSC